MKINNFLMTYLVWICFSTIFIKSSCRQDKKQLKQSMSMPEVEIIFGKPKKTTLEKGKIDNGYENPTIIRWYYDKYPIETSDESYGKPGYINFVPERFIVSNAKISKADSTAWELGEQSNSYRVTSFIGSFPADTINKEWIGSDMGAIPVKVLKGKSH